MVINPQLVQIKTSRMNFKQEWAEIMMDAVEIPGGSENRVYKITGLLQDIQDKGAVILLAKGIVLHLPLEYIRLDLA